MRLFDRSEPGAWVSGAAHAALLAAAIVGFAWEAFPEAQEGIPVEVISDSLFSEMTRGEKQADVVQPDLKPRVDRVAESVEERDPGEASKAAPSPPTRPAEMKVAAREVEPPPPMPPRREVAKIEPPPEPPRREVERKPEAKPEEPAKLAARAAEQALAKAEAKAAEAKARAEADARQKAEAEAEARDLAEAEAKAAAQAKAVAEAKLRAEAKAKAEAEAKAKRQAEIADRFNPGDIRQLLASKEPAQATGSTGRELQRTAALGTATGTSQRLNPSQLSSLIGLLTQQIERNYAAPPGAALGPVTLPVMEIRLNVDGSLAAEPRLMRVGSKPIDRAVADAAMRAVRRSAPFQLPAQFAPFYGDWKLLNVEFNPT